MWSDDPTKSALFSRGQLWERDRGADKVPFGKLDAANVKLETLGKAWICRRDLRQGGLPGGILIE